MAPLTYTMCMCIYVCVGGVVMWWVACRGLVHMVRICMFVSDVAWCVMCLYVACVCVWCGMCVGRYGMGIHWFRNILKLMDSFGHNLMGTWSGPGNVYGAF